MLKSRYTHDPLWVTVLAYASLVLVATTMLYLVFFTPAPACDDPYCNCHHQTTQTNR